MTEATDKFNAMMAEKAGVVMPIDFDDGSDGIPGFVVDANGDVIAMIDPLGEMGASERKALAMLIVLAVNTCGSFRAEMEPTS